MTHKTDASRIEALRNVPCYSQVRLIDWGSIDEIDDDVSFTVDDVLTVWTGAVEPTNRFASVEVRGLIGRSSEIEWLPDDAMVEVVATPRFAGLPEDLTRGLAPMRAPEGGDGVLVTPDGFHPLIWDSDILFRPVQGWSDPETSVEVILCALNVAPDDGILLPQLLAALRARYARVIRRPGTYPPECYPWRQSLEPNAALIEYLTR